MNIAKIVYLDEANGEGLRTSVFVSGCNRHCPGCFNEVAWDFNYGIPMDEEKLHEIVDSVGFDECAGLSVLGGEPMEKENQYWVMRMMLEVNHRYPEKTIWLYSGFTYEWITDDNFENLTEWTYMILILTDVLVDGPFVQDKRDLTLRFRGSSNQRILDMKKTFEEGHPIFYKDYNETK